MITTSKIKYTRRFDLIKLGFHLGIAGVLILLSLYFFPILLCMMAAYFTLRAYESPVQEQVSQTPSIILVSLAASILVLSGSVMYGSHWHKRS